MFGKFGKFGKYVQIDDGPAIMVLCSPDTPDWEVLRLAAVQVERAKKIDEFGDLYKQAARR